MKRILSLIAVVAAISSSTASCTREFGVKEDGTLSLADFVISYDSEDLVTKAATPAGGNYVISIVNAEGTEVTRTTYSAVKDNDNKISLPAGEYIMNVSSSGDGVPVAAFEQPVYGTSTTFSISAGETTTVGALTCTLLQCKVTVDYSEEFLAMVTGDGAATVEVTSGSPLSYSLTYDSATGKVGSYDKSAGYFAVNNGEKTTLDVTFKGSVDGKSQKMTKTLTGIQPKQWRQIKFIKKVNSEGTATFSIVINNLVGDEVLNEELAVNEEVIAEDPTAPKGDGGIVLSLDYDAGCDAEFTDLGNLVIPPVATRDIKLMLKASVPNAIKKFTVNIDSTNDSFKSAVAAAGAENLDLINPTEDNAIIFDVVPFPHGTDLVGKTEVAFDLSAAQDAIIVYPGTHYFTMNVTDAKGCKKAIPVVMVVNE